MRRLTGRQRLRETVAKMDAFPKVEPEIQQKSSSGALTTILTFLVISFLVFYEFQYYNEISIKYDFAVDKDMRRDLNMTLDITVAMKCDYLGADYIDISGNSYDTTKNLLMEPAHFELSPNQREWVDIFAATKMEEGSRGLDSLNRFLHGSVREPMPEAAPELSSEPDSCRIHGVVYAHKIAANFHITGGKSFHHARGHSHLFNAVPREAFNFSHRIDRLSFSEEKIGAHTLDGEYKVTKDRMAMFQYFLKVVPATTKRLGENMPYRSNQYSVTEQQREAATNGLPGIFLKFEMEAVAVNVVEQRRSMKEFLVRIVGIVGGIFATSGMLHSLMASTVATLKQPGVLSNPVVG